MESIRATLRHWQIRQLRRLPIIATILCVQLLAVTSLYLGYTAFQSLSISIGVGIAYLSFPSVGLILLLVSHLLRVAVRLVVARLGDRRTYQFSLRTMLLAVLLFSIACAWYGYRFQQVREEWGRLEGKWQVVDENGDPGVLPNGERIIVDLTPEHHTVDPSRDPKWLDIHTPTGTLEAIYRWEGPRLYVFQVTPGLQRPMSFDQKFIEIPRKPDVRSAAISCSMYWLERLPPD